MDTIGSYEAKTHLPALLRRVEEGEEIVITRHGRPIARLIPAGGPHEGTTGDVIDALRAFRGRHALGPELTVRDLIDEGRR